MTSADECKHSGVTTPYCPRCGAKLANHPLQHLLLHVGANGRSIRKAVERARKNADNAPLAGGHGRGAWTPEQWRKRCEAEALRHVEMAEKWELWGKELQRAIDVLIGEGQL